MSKLERVTYICLITLCVLSAGLLTNAHVSSYLANKQRQPPSADSLIGKHLNISGVTWAGSPANAVIYYSTVCHFCQASTPFYRRILEARQTTPGHEVSISVLSLEPAEQVSELRMLRLIALTLFTGFITARAYADSGLFYVTCKDGSVQSLWVDCPGQNASAGCACNTWNVDTGYSDCSPYPICY